MLDKFMFTVCTMCLSLSIVSIWCKRLYNAFCFFVVAFMLAMMGSHGFFEVGR